MAEIRFYHLQMQSLDQALPLLLRKALDGNKKIIVRIGAEERLDSLSESLWGYRPDGFLPHGTKKDDHAADQPVYLTDGEENPNGADMIVLAEGGTAEDVDKFDLCCEMLNGQNAEEVQAARVRWKAYKDAGHSVTYWQQTERGGWEQKA